MSKQACLAIAAAALLGCGGGGASPMSPPGGNTPPPPGGISVTNNAYTPASDTVTVGTTVRWAWNSCSGNSYSGQTCVSHSVTFDDGVTSPTQDQGAFSRMFATAGTYNYHCAVHGTAMSGTITVK